MIEGWDSVGVVIRRCSDDFRLGSTVIGVAFLGSGIVGVSGITAIVAESWIGIVDPGSCVGLSGKCGHGTVLGIQISGTTIEHTLGSTTIPSIS